MINEKAFVCKGWRGALCTFCVLGGEIRQKRRPETAGQFGKEGRHGGAVQQRQRRGGDRRPAAIRQGGKTGGTAGAGAAMLCRGYPGIGGGGSGKTAGSLQAWGRIHHPHPLPHSTALDYPPCRFSFPPAKLRPPLLPCSYTARRGRGGVPEKMAAGLWKRRGEIITGNSPGYGGLSPWPGFARLARKTNLWA